MTSNNNNQLNKKTIKKNNKIMKVSKKMIPLK